MLAYILAIAIALSSLILYLSAFFLPELHRRDDFLWSGVGLFYALVLWVCAERITGGVLLGQSAAVALVLSFGWQTVKLRRAIAHPEEQTDLEGASITNWIQRRLSGKKKAVAPVTKSEPPITSPTLPEQEDSLPAQDTPQAVEQADDTSMTLGPEIEPKTEVETEMATNTAPSVSPPPIPQKKGFSLKSLLGFGKKSDSPPPQTITEALDASEAQNQEQWDEEDSSDTTVTPVEETTSDQTNNESLIEDENLGISVTPVEEKTINQPENESLIDETASEAEKPSNFANETPEDDLSVTVSDAYTEPVTPETSSPDIAIDEAETIEEIEFEPFMSDDEAETIIEANITELYPSEDEKAASSEISNEIETQPAETEREEESNWIDDTEMPDEKSEPKK